MEQHPIKDYGIPFRNLYETLECSAQRFPDKVAVIDDNGQYTYRELQDRVDRLADVLKYQYRMGHQEQIAFITSNSVHMLTAFYAAMKLGCIAVMVNTKFSSFEMDRLLQTMEVQLIIADEEWRNKVCRLEAAASCHGILTESTPIHPNQNYAALRPTTCPDDTAVIMHTSGTTGTPKGIMVSQRNIMEASYGYRQVLGLDDATVSVLSVPIFHILGLSCVSTLILFLGGTLILSARYRLEDVLDKIKRYHATHFHSVPAIYLDILHSSYPDKDLQSLQVAVCGGAPIQDHDVDAFCKLAPNARFVRAYGMTETAGSGTLATVHKGPVRAVPNVGVSIVDEQDQELPPCKIGEVVFTGPCVATKRWKALPLPTSRLHSGDVGYMDDDGNIYLIDRLKDIINRGGEKIFPAQIEEVILTYPGVQSVSVYGISDARYGEVPAAAIIPQPGFQIDVEQLHQFLKERFAKYERPTQIHIVQSFPVTQNGKVRKTLLREMTERGELV